MAASLLSGCALFGGGNKVDVAGKYVGHWYAADPTKPLGDLIATIVPAEDGAWNATFDATFGGSGSYEVDLKGKREGDRVVFAGSENLGGASGGVFNWNGWTDGKTFHGEYTSQIINGTFKMTKSE